MPLQTQITISDNGDGTQSVNLPGASFNVDLFNPQSSQQQILDNIRLAYLIGGYAQLASVEFLNGVNQAGKGISGATQDYYITSVTLTDPANQYYSVGFGAAPGAPDDFTIDDIASAQLSQDTRDPNVIVPNVSSRLRLAGYTGMAQAINGLTAAQYIAAQNFWY